MNGRRFRPDRQLISAETHSAGQRHCIELLSKSETLTGASHSASCGLQVIGSLMRPRRPKILDASSALRRCILRSFPTFDDEQVDVTSSYFECAVAQWRIQPEDDLPPFFFVSKNIRRRKNQIISAAAYRCISLLTSFFRASPCIRGACRLCDSSVGIEPI